MATSGGLWISAFHHAGPYHPAYHQNVEPFDPDTVRIEYLYQAVADHLAARIADGEWSHGRLPGITALAEEYRVGDHTVRSAIVELRRRGLVATLPHKGTYVIGLEGS